MSYHEPSLFLDFQSCLFKHGQYLMPGAEVAVAAIHKS
jgi:hypothetical protein